jgi:ribosomal protein S18 acetylase RimI-like enzyme
MAGYDGHRGWVNYLAVQPEFQRRGYGQALMQAVEQGLLAMGCPKINLQVRSNNESVLAFYRHIGYVQDEVVSLGRRLIPDT